VHKHATREHVVNEGQGGTAQAEPAPAVAAVTAQSGPRGTRAGPAAPGFVIHLCLHGYGA